MAVIHPQSKRTSRTIGRRQRFIVQFPYLFHMFLLLVLSHLPTRTMSSMDPHQQHQQDQDPSLSVSPPMSTYTTTFAPTICHQIPKESFTRLWNRVMTRDNQQKKNKIYYSSTYIPRMADLRRGIRTRPRISYWKQLVNRLSLSPSSVSSLSSTSSTSTSSTNHNQNQLNTVVILLLIPPLLSPSDNHPHLDRNNNNQGIDDGTTKDILDHLHSILTQKLEYWKQSHISLTTSTTDKGGWKPITWRIQQYPYQNPKDGHLNPKDEEFMSSSSVLFQDVDVVIDATGDFTAKIIPTQQTLHPNDGDQSVMATTKTTTTTTPMTPDYANQLRTEKQKWIRQFFLLPATTRNSQQRTPSLILLDGLFPTDLGAWNAMATTRGLQELADWYQIPFLSVHTILHPMKYQRQQRYSSILQSFIATQTTNQQWKDKDSIAPLLLQFHVAIDLLAFAFWDFTIDICQSSSSSFQSHHHQPTKQNDMSNLILDEENPPQHPPKHPVLPILQENVDYMTEYVIPPFLDLSLTLEQVSEEWRKNAS